uniref:Kunitz-type serine protease inhibitor vestiginin-3 n=1 Tax=Demansia vestigiata TaxID=412038 RepID=VKT3_DEMVE|nr:RecName: Full=Kunitz-type serine protease inhibitor vestiginin-3; Flags: Precursor [Demansia vestigiata]ABK63553.1 vestiginin-3 precursor [Demansia vestigiata]ACC77809.1 vestiginin-3 precursor [Demansia vestigiata]
MSSGGLLLLLGLLTLWAELTPVSSKDLPEICKLPKEPGPCRSYLLYFYYNSVEHKCQTFHYGGCEGNENRFHTIEECKSTCAE